jgi:hypothetical protein
MPPVFLIRSTEGLGRGGYWRLPEIRIASLQTGNFAINLSKISLTPTGAAARRRRDKICNFIPPHG